MNSLEVTDLDMEGVCGSIPHAPTNNPLPDNEISAAEAETASASGKEVASGVPHFADIARFWTKVAVGRRGDCWLWQAASHRDGYGYFKADGDVWTSHRFAYAAVRGEIPAGLVVRHTCDRPACCNPDHLELGTHADNVRDRVERGRSATGERNGRWKGRVAAASEPEPSLLVERAVVREKPRMVPVTDEHEIESIKRSELGDVLGGFYDGRWWAYAWSLERYRETLKRAAEVVP